jgi:DNA-binding response OmpR family regulator
VLNDKGTLLIVEDEVSFRTIYRDLFQGEGYGVLTAEDGETGWALTRKEKPDLVLLDLKLPKLDGYEVLRRIREDDDTKKIPVLIFSVMEDQQDVRKAMDLGADDYTVKGYYTSRQILQKIEELLAQG